MLLHKSMSLPRKGSENWTCNQIALGCLCAIEAASRPKGFKSKTSTEPTLNDAAWPYRLSAFCRTIAAIRVQHRMRPLQKPRKGSIFYRRAFLFSQIIVFNQSLPFFEDSSDATCRVVHVIFVEVLE